MEFQGREIDRSNEDPVFRLLRLAKDNLADANQAKREAIDEFFKELGTRIGESANIVGYPSSQIKVRQIQEGGKTRTISKIGSIYSLFDDEPKRPYTYSEAKIVGVQPTSATGSHMPTLQIRPRDWGDDDSYQEIPLDMIDEFSWVVDPEVQEV